MLRSSLALGLLALAACGPVPVEVAERQCAERARLAASPTGEVSLGVASDGSTTRPVARTEITVSSDFLMRRDPQKLYQTCVFDRSGQPPTRPLVL
jgi:hypothetical protein